MLRTRLTLRTAELIYKPFIRPRERDSIDLELGYKSTREIDQLRTANAKVFITRDGRGRVVNAR